MNNPAVLRAELAKAGEEAKAKLAKEIAEEVPTPDKVPEVGFTWRPAKTKAEAKRIMQDIIDECNRRDTYTRITQGTEEGVHYIKFWHKETNAGGWSLKDHHTKPHSWKADRIHGNVWISPKSTLSELNAINRQLAALQERSSLMNLPPLRGCYTWAKKTKWGACMGDGYMGTHHDSFGYYFGNLQFDRVKYSTNLAKAVDEQRKLLVTIEALEGKNSRAYKAVQEQIDMRLDELRKIEEGTWDGPMYGTAKSKPTKWRPGDDVTERPSSSADYFGNYVDKGNSLMDHEYGHHIHQQLFVDGNPDLYRKPPLEVWIKYYYEQNPQTSSSIRKLVPSTYSLKQGTWGQEWFAESYALWKGGAKHAVPKELAGMFELFDDLEQGKITYRQLKYALFDDGDFARPIIPPVKGVYKEVAEVADNVDEIYFKTVHILKKAEAEGKALSQWDLKGLIEEEFKDTVFSWDVEKAMTKALNRDIVVKQGNKFLYTGPGKVLRDIETKKLKFKMPETMRATKPNIAMWDKLMEYSYGRNEPVRIQQLMDELGFGYDLSVVRTFFKELYAFGVVDRTSVSGFTAYFVKNADSYLKG